MNRHTLFNIAAMTAIGLAALAGSAVSQETGEHKLISPEDIKWGPAPPSLPPGAQAAVHATRLGSYLCRVRAAEVRRNRPYAARGNFDNSRSD